MQKQILVMRMPPRSPRRMERTLAIRCAPRGGLTARHSSLCGRRQEVTPGFSTAVNANPELDAGRQLLWLLASLLRSRILEERLNLALKSVLVHHASVRVGDLAISIDEQCQRQARNAKLTSQFRIADYDWIIDFVRCEEWLH